MNTNILIISSRSCGKKHVSYNTVLGLEDEFSNCTEKEILRFRRSFYYTNKMLRMLHIPINISDIAIIKRINNTTEKILFTAMGYSELEAFSATLKKCNDRLILYIFDCWESQWDEWENIFAQINPWAICFAYKKARNHFAELRNNCWFMPQSMDIRFFHDYEVEKSRLFIQMGRLTNKMHDMVISYLQTHNIENCYENYVYERKQGEIVFPDSKQLAEEIARSYFFIAVPQNIENSAKTGDISETTARYYEAMACKTLIIGIKPKDSFDELFPYGGAMVEVDETNFNTAIEELLKDRNYYNNLVERNYRYVMQNHRWKNRYDSLIEMIKAAYDDTDFCYTR